MMNADKPKISVLMPAYNCEKYICESIDSILGQTFKDFELIIIDDGSTDNTWDIIQKYGKKDSRIKVLKNEINLGISKTRNKLVALSIGEYILWQDSDDISMPNRILHQYTYMKNNPSVGICGGFVEFFNIHGEKSIRKYDAEDKTLRKKIFRYSPVAQPASIVRRKALVSAGPFPEIQVAEDLAMTFKIGTSYELANLQEIVIQYRENETGATFTKLREMELYTLYLRRLYSHHPSYNMNLTDKIYNLLQNISLYTIPSRLKIKLFKFFRNI